MYIKQCDCNQGRLPCTCLNVSDADMARYALDPYRKAVATMARRDCSDPTRVVFHFKDGSTLGFKKSYEIEPS